MLSSINIFCFNHTNYLLNEQNFKGGFSHMVSNNYESELNVRKEKSAHSGLRATRIFKHYRCFFIQLHLQPFWFCAVDITLIYIRVSPLWRSFSPLSYLNYKRHPPLLRVGWLPFCCLFSAWSWSCTPAGAGVNAAASLSHRRVLVRRQLMRSTTSPQCWWEAKPVRA